MTESSGHSGPDTDRLSYECKQCGETFVGDRWEPEHPDDDCTEHEDGQHVWAEECDDNV